MADRIPPAPKKRPKTLEPFPEAIGPYRPLRLLGSGGMAGVYLCLGPEGEEVAVKWLNRATPRLRQRFAREARAMLRVSHPDIVHVLGQGVAQGRPYLVMDYVAGEDLRVYAPKLQERPAAERVGEVRRIGIAICRALQAVHAVGLVHRDVKPSNVLLDLQGGVFLTDFGVVKDLEDADRTQVGILVGTASYASPEQIRSEPVDHRTDLYGLGCTLFFVATGRRPFPSRKRDEVIQAHLSSPVPHLRTIDPTLPKELEAIIVRLMAKQREDRFQGARAVRQALEGLGRGTGSAAPPPLAGRQRYVEQVRDALRTVADGSGAVIRAVGPKGSGRHWLLEVTEDLGRRMSVPTERVSDPASLHAAAERVASGETLAVITRLPDPVSARELIIELEPLGMADVRRTVVSVAPNTPQPHQAAERLHRLSGGHPAWLLPLLEAHRRGDRLELPDAMTEPTDLAATLDRLDFEALETLGSLAVLGQPVTVTALEEVTQIPAKEPLASLAEAGLVAGHSGSWWVMGELVAEAARERLPDPDAVDLRARRAMSRFSPPPPPGPPSAPVRMPKPPPHKRDLVEALETAEALAVSGKLAAAREKLEGTVATAHARQAGKVEAWALRLLGTVLLDLGEAQLAQVRLADAVALARAVNDPGERRAGHVLRALATLDARPGNPSAASSALSRLRKAADITGPDPAGFEALRAAVSARASAVLGDQRSFSGSRDAAVSAMSAASWVVRLRAELELSRAALVAGDLAASRQHADQCGAEAGARGWMLFAWLASRVRATTAGLPAPEPGTVAEGLSEAELDRLTRKPVH